MKKLLIILMVVAMASFLFVGCIPTTPDVDEDDEEPVPTPPPATVAPIIISVPDISGGYINKLAASDGLVVSGTAPTYSEVKVYINGLCAGTGDTTETGTFQVDVANADLIKAVKVDGAKTLYATATEPGLEESASSNVIKFILDTDAPGIDSVAATADVAFAAGTAIVQPTANNLITQAPAFDAATTSADLVPGTWHLLALSTTDVLVTDPNNNFTYLGGIIGGESYPETLIPGVTIDFHAGALVAGEYVNIVCVADTAAIAGRATLKFDEDVSSGAANAGTYAGTDVAAPPFVFKESNDTAYWTGITTLVTNATMVITVTGVVDLAGNPIPALSSANCIVGPANATLLAP